MNRQPEYLKRTNPKLGEMLGWPGTPGMNRLMRAVFMLQDGEDHPDARIMAGIQRTMAFRDEALEGYRVRDEERRTGPNPDPQGQIALMAQAALEGSDGDFIGMCIANDAILNESQAGMMAVAFTRIPRDQDWMGMEPAWPDCRDQGMHIFGIRDSNGRDRPCLAMSLPRKVGPEGKSTPVIPTGEAAGLSLIALWHGADITAWVRMS